MKQIRLTQGKFTLVDDQDFDWLNQRKWHFSIGGANGYACTRIGKKHVLMHRLLLDRPIGKEIDHINRNQLDNRRENLRVCTHKENRRNSESNRGVSKYKGVYWSKTAKKWCARIMADSKRFLIGYFSTERQAAMAYDIWAKDLFGEFAYLNFNSN